MAALALAGASRGGPPRSPQAMALASQLLAAEGDRLTWEQARAVVQLLVWAAKADERLGQVFDELEGEELASGVLGPVREAAERCASWLPAAAAWLPAGARA